MQQPSNPNLRRDQFKALDTQLRHTPEEQGGGGFSHSVSGEPPPSSGYIVSDPGETRYDTSKSRAQDPTHGYSPSRLPQFVKQPGGAFHQSGVYFGGWLEHNEGKTEAVFDTSRSYGTSEAGHKAMRRNDQKAMYQPGKRTYIHNLHHPENQNRILDNMGILGQ